jgi:peptidyl-prolyl cis-trans isomerase SurA
MKILIKNTVTSLHLSKALVLSALVSALLITSLSFHSKPTWANNQSQLLDQVIAIVDDDVVLASELRERMEQVETNIKKSGKDAPPMEKIQQEILDQLILENIQLQMAYRAGVRISDAQLNESMQRIANQNRMDLMQFKQALEGDGLSYNGTREQIRKEMLLQRVQQGNVNQRVQITDQEIANFLASQEGIAMTAPEYRMLHTLIPVPSAANDSILAQAKRKANRLYQLIKNGKAYEEVMAANPQLSTNDLGWRKASDLPSLIANLAATTQEGQTAEPVQSPSGFHLVKLADKRGEGEVIPQTKARHILLKASAIRDEAATEAGINSLRQQILDGADFDELAREYSEDIGSALEGGNLGWTSPGQLVAAFQNAMDSTKPGDISPAFRSQYGWHILQVEERRDKDVTEDIRRNIARNHIHQRKFDDELQTWLQKIRDEAYVDFK